jgi:hypothetical protein
VERSRQLVIFPCGTSITENARFNLYYEPQSRPRKWNSFLGLYNNKKVSYVGTLQTVAVCSYRNDIPDFTEEVGQLTNDRRRRITDAIEATTYYNLKASPHRFYLVDDFVPTKFEKASPGGIMGFRYLDLTKFVPTFDLSRSYTTVELASMLAGASWV